MKKLFPFGTHLCIEYGGDCPRTQIPIGGNLQIESERPDDMGKTSESLAELGGNQSGYAQEISNRKFETPSNGVIGRPGGGRGAPLKNMSFLQQQI